MEYLTQQQYMIESQNKYFMYIALTHNSKVIYVINLVNFSFNIIFFCRIETNTNFVLYINKIREKLLKFYISFLFNLKRLY